jgi:phosphomannomutase/phosphoglucomutase
LEYSVTEGPVTSSKISKRALRNAIIVTACTTLSGLALLAGGWYYYGQLATATAQEYRQSRENNAKAYAAAIAGPFDAISEHLRNIARQEHIIELITQGNLTQLGIEAETLLSEFEAALKIRFFLPGQYQLDNSSNPPLSFASLDLLKTAESSTDEIGADVHLFGTPKEHIVMVRRVNNKAGTLAGLIHLSLDTALFKQAISGLSLARGYLELQQGDSGNPLILGKSGDASQRNGYSINTAVTSTRWSLVYWPADQEETASDSDTWLISLGLVVIFLTALTYFLLRRKQGKQPETVTDIVYCGAIEAIMEGVHPGMEKLIPHLPGEVRNKQLERNISRGLEGEDITRITSPGKEAAAATAGTDGLAAIPDSFDITAAAAAADFLDITADAAPDIRDIQKNKQPDEASKAVELSKKIFRTYDIRGVAGTELTAESVARIGQAIGSEATARGETQIIVGRDGRNSGPELLAALITGLQASGCDVIDIGMVPTPVLYFATHYLEPDSGVILTGSHNPPEYNGLKIVIAGETLSEDAIQVIYNRVVENNLVSGNGTLQTTDINADYIRRIAEDIPVALGKSFRIVVDCGNGVTGKLAPQLYRALGHDVIELHCEIDGNFPNHHPDPSQPDNLQDLIARVIAEHADLGFAFDGDGDRLGVVDNKGNIIWPDRQMMMLASDVLSRNKGAEIIYDVKCSRHLKSTIESGGGKPLMWKTGHSLIKSKMKQTGALLAGEMSGHIFFKERWYGFDDALYTGARILEILLNADTGPAEVFDALPDYLATPELRVDLPEEEHQGFMEEIQKKMAFKDAEIITIDGLRVEFTDGWGLVRPSNTTPCLVLRFEADNQAALARIQSQFHTLMLAIKPDLSLPF